jgi:hypothetical protein
MKYQLTRLTQLLSFDEIAQLDELDEVEEIAEVEEEDLRPILNSPFSINPWKHSPSCRQRRQISKPGVEPRRNPRTGCQQDPVAESDE